MKAASRQKLLHIFVLFVVFFLFGYRYYNADMLDYTATQLARYDNTLFTRDLVAAADSVTFTPKFFNDVLIVGMMRLGLSWPTALTILYFLAALIMVSAIVSIVHQRCSKYRLCVGLAAITALFFLTLGHAVGNNTLWDASFRMQTLSVAIGFWALYFALKEPPKWWAANGVLCIVALFSVQVALYFFVAVLLLMLFNIFGFAVTPNLSTQTEAVGKIRKFSPLLSCIPFLAVGATYFALVSRSSASVLSNRQFIDIYVKLRNPHHLYPLRWSRFNVGLVVLAALVLLVLVWRAYRLDGVQGKQHYLQVLRPTSAFFIVAILVVLSMVLFSTIIPWETIFKAYPSRYFIVLRIWMIGLLCGTIYRYLRNKETAAVIFCIICLATSAPAFVNNYSFVWMLFLTAVMWLASILTSKYPTHARTLNILKNVALYVGGVLWALIQFYLYGFSVTPIFAVIIFIIFLIIEQTSQKQFLRYSAVTAVAVLMLLQGYRLYPGIFFQPAEQVFANGVSQPHYDFAIKLKDVTEKDALILYNPIDEKQNYFRMYGQRSALVSWKVVPTSDAELLEWFDRLDALGCIRINEDGDYERVLDGFMKMDGSDVIRIAQEYGVDYIIATKEDSTRFTDAGLDNIVLQDDSFTLFSLN